MDSDQKMIIRIVLYVAVMVLLLVGMFTGCVVHSNYCVLKAIQGGTDPTSANRAFSSSATTTGSEVALIEAIKQNNNKK